MFNWHDLIALMPVLVPVAFFWTCRCCSQTCSDWCPEGAPQQLQITVPAATYDASGTPDVTCEESQCNERTGVVLTELEPTATAEVNWFTGNFPWDESYCLYLGPEFDTCVSYIDDIITGEPILQTETMRWQIQFRADVMDVYLCVLDASNHPTTLIVDRWQGDISTADCGDTIVAPYSDPGFSISGGGCVLDTGESVTVEVPP